MRGMADLGFWMTAGGGAALVALTLALAFLRTDRQGLGGADSDILLYKSQLADIDKDVARGVLPQEEAEAARVDVKRRLLAADRAARQAGAQTAGPRAWPGAALIVVVLGGAIGLYTTIGAPSYGDLPLKQRLAALDAARSDRPGQLAAETVANLPEPDMSRLDPQFADLMERLRSTIETRPNDVEGLRLLARNEARIGRVGAARAAQEQLIAVLGGLAGAAEHAHLAELSVAAAGGYVSPEAEAAADAALEIDPKSETARYFKGLAELQGGRPDLAYDRWNALLADSPADAPFVPLIQSQLPQVAELAGIPFRGPERPNFGENEEMIRGMVNSLGNRLAEQGGTAEEWARLIHSLGVLGEHEQAGMIAAEARSVFAGNQEAVGMIDAALSGSGERP